MGRAITFAWVLIVTQPSCSSSGASTGEDTLERCTDSIDNDHDGLVDCEDPRCGVFARCAGERCDGGCLDGGTSSDCAPSGPLLALAAGFVHSCAVRTDGTLWCWGSNSDGQLGTGSGLVDRPVVVQKPAGVTAWSTVWAGDFHSCALSVEGEAFCWGRNDRGQVGTGEVAASARSPVRVATDQRFVQGDSGASHTCAVTTGGSLWCWGDDSSGQLGNGDGGSSPSPVRVTGAWTAVAAGDAHTCAVDRASGTLECWGANGDGQLGIGALGGVDTPTSVSGRWEAVTCGGLHTCGITENGDASCWGANSDGQLGVGDTDSPALEPRAVLGGSSWELLAAGFLFTCGVEGGALKCWGRNGSRDPPIRFCPLGLGDASDDLVLYPQTVGIGFSLVAASSGYHACALRQADGRVALECWGANSDGMLGAGDAVPVREDGIACEPVQVCFPTGP